MSPTEYSMIGIILNGLEEALRDEDDYTLRVLTRSLNGLLNHEEVVDG